MEIVNGVIVYKLENRKMNKSELIKALADKTSGTQSEAKAFLEAFTDTVGDVLKSGDKITLVGFGTFAE